LFKEMGGLSLEAFGEESEGKKKRHFSALRGRGVLTRKGGKTCFSLARGKKELLHRNTLKKRGIIARSRDGKKGGRDESLTKR